MIIKEEFDNSWKDCSTVGELKRALDKYDDNTPIYQYNGNYSPNRVTVFVKPDNVNKFGHSSKEVTAMMIDIDLS